LNGRDRCQLFSDSARDILPLEILGAAAARHHAGNNAVSTIIFCFSLVGLCFWYRCA